MNKSTKYTILCVDDNENNLFTLEALLRTLEGVDILTALSGEDALKILLKEHVDLILSDIQMPEMDGFELAQLIKSNKRTKDIPIIFVTAVFKSEEFIKRGFNLGAVDYITKPIDEYQLRNKLILYIKIFQEKNIALENEQRFYEITQSITEGIYTVDLEHKLTFINDKALELLGYEKEELMGKIVHDYIHYKDIDNKLINVEDCIVHTATLLNQKIYREDEHLIKKDGSFLNVSLEVTPLYNHGEMVGSIVVFEDKTTQNLLVSMQKEKIKTQEQIIYSMVNMIESRDTYTAGHTRRVANYCVLIAKQMQYSKEEIELLQKAAWLHDIGKISTPDSILLKPGKLDNDEYNLIQEHLNSGYNMLSQIDNYKDIADIMREHHEKYNGTGYPRGLKGDEINPLSRIMMVADAFDAMTTNRVYKPKKSVEVSLKELQSLSGIHFHPEVVEGAVLALKEIDIDENASQLPSTQMEQARFSYYYKDTLTKLFTVEYLEIYLRYHIKVSKFYAYSIELHSFSQYNQQYSWKKGDKYLREFAAILKQLSDKSVVFRIEGDDFLVLCEHSLQNIKETLQQFTSQANNIVTCDVKEEVIEDTQAYLNRIISENEI